MNQQEILKKIGGIIAELKDQYTYLNAAENGFNELELELFMANAHFLTDHIGILQKINHQSVTVSLPAAKTVLQIEETPQKLVTPDYFDEQELLAVAEPDQFDSTNAAMIEPPLEEVPPVEKTIILPEEMPQNDIFSAPHEVIILPEAMPQTEPLEDLTEDASFTGQKLTSEPDLKEENFDLKDIAAEHQTIRPETVSLDAQPETASTFSISSVSDTTSKTEPAFLTLNERIAAQKGLDQPKSKTENTSNKVQDLQSIISLNDKLLFVKELFNGYNLAYAEAINILNRYTNMEQAENFLKTNYAVKNNWKDKPVAAEKFMNLLQKKFA